MGGVVEVLCGSAGDLAFDVFFEFGELLAGFWVVEAVEASTGAVSRLCEVVLWEFWEVVVDDVFDS